MKRRVILLAVLLLLLLPAATALAGGWVVISLDKMPDQIQAGEATTLSFMVRQHGKTPIHSVEPKLTATNTETGQRIQVDAEPMKELGRYMVTVDFPSEGVWEWSISAEPFPQTATFAPLTILAAPAPAPETSAPNITGAPGLDVQAALRWVSLAMLAVAVLLFIVGRQRGRTVAPEVSPDGAPDVSSDAASDVAAQASGD